MSSVRSHERVRVSVSICFAIYVYDIARQFSKYILLNLLM